MTISHVYKVTNILNNKIYIGKANDPQKRWKNHLYTVKSGERKFGFRYLHAAIRKNKKENFLFEVIEVCDSEDLAFEREKYWIQFYNSNDREKGYNLTSGGEGPSGRKCTEEEKLQKSIYMTEYWKNHPHPALGSSLTEEHKRIISEANRGRIVSEESKLKISEANSGDKNGMANKPYSLEERIKLGIKISEGKKKQNRPKQVFTEETMLKLKLAYKEKASQKLTWEEKDLIIELYDSGKFIKKDLAVKFNIELKTIKYIIRYWKNIKNNKSKFLIDKNNIIEMYLLNKYTQQQIAENLNISFNKVRNEIRKYKKIA